MPRRRRRRIRGNFRHLCFKPCAQVNTLLDNVTLTKDELEAIRLADLKGLYHEDSANEMDVSRPTFGRILNSARQKIADALINGKTIEISD